MIKNEIRCIDCEFINNCGTTDTRKFKSAKQRDIFIKTVNYPCIDFKQRSNKCLVSLKEK